MVETFNISNDERFAHGSDGAEAGPLVFVSGQAALGPGSEVLFPGDIAAQTKFVVQRIEDVLNGRGASLSDVASVSVFLQKPEDFAAFNTAYAEAFGNHRPTRTTVVVQLLVDGMLIEASAIASRQSA